MKKNGKIMVRFVADAEYTYNKDGRLMDARKVKFPPGAMTSRELIDSKLEAYIAESGGTREAAALAGLAHSTLNRIRRGELNINEPLAHLLGYKQVKWRFYVPIRRREARQKSARARK